MKFRGDGMAPFGKVFNALGGRRYWQKNDRIKIGVEKKEKKYKILKYDTKTGPW
jgi:hypothetical protein